MRCEFRSPRARVRAMFLLVAVATAACTDGSVPTSASSVSAPTAPALSTSAERSTAPATLAWQERGRGFVVRSRSNPLNSARIYGLLGMAQYGAAVAADQALGITGPDDASVIGSDDGGRAQFEMRRGAIGGASHAILTYLADVAFIPPLVNATTLREAEKLAMTQQLAAEGVGRNGRVHPQFSRGVEIGKAMGEVMVAWASTDGFSAPFTHAPYLPAPGGGVWFQTGTPAGYQWAAIRPYFLTSASQFAAPAPPAFGSPQFLSELAQVVAAVNGRTPQQLQSSLDWNLNLGTVSAAGYWGERAGERIVAGGLGDRSASHVYALMGAAVMDATIGCWDTKFTQLVMRPSQSTNLLPAALLPLGLPNHPSYPSGHSCVSAAAASIIASFFGDESGALAQDVHDAGMSRIYAGIHFPFDVAAGQQLGRDVAGWAVSYDRTRGLLSAVGR